MDMIIFPKNGFEKIVSKVFEKLLPSITYFTWREAVADARKSGYTIQEKFFHHFFRQKNIYFHAYAQQLHPWTYQDRQRNDAFMRRLETLIPGVEAPVWAQQQRKVQDFDFESMDVAREAYAEIKKEATPAPHFNTPNYFVLHHFFDNRYNFGVNASRFFFNEEIRGSFASQGYFTKADKQYLNSWFSGDRAAQMENYMNGTKAEKEEILQNISKWIKNIEEYFPETKNMNTNTQEAKHIKEPYALRNLDDIRDKVWVSKFIENYKKQVFSDSEWHKIKEVFLGEQDHHFFQRDEHDNQYHGTELYGKFIKAFDLPDVFSLIAKSGKIPEHQFLGKLDVKWQINFQTANVFKHKFEEIQEEFRNGEFYKSLSTDQIHKIDDKINLLLGEEIYNPLFVHHLGGSIKNNLTSLDKVNELIELSNTTREETKFLHRKYVNAFLFRSRKVVQAIPFIGSS